jgi:hypothetical protein
MSTAEAESKEKHGTWNPMPELTITSPYVHTPGSTPTHLHGQPGMPESTFTLCRSRLYPPISDFEFGLCTQEPKQTCRSNSIFILW